MVICTSEKPTSRLDPEAYNSTNRAMNLETSYRRKVPSHWPAGSSSDLH